MKSFNRYLGGAFLAAAIPLDSGAQVYKCLDDDGRVMYQAAPCPGVKDSRPVTGSVPGAPLLSERVTLCEGQSDILQAAIERVRRDPRDFEATHRLRDIRPVYVRDCSPFGYRIPDTPANIAHNKSFGRDSGPPIPKLDGFECVDLESSVRIGVELRRQGRQDDRSRKMNENMAQKYIRDCERFGYKMPDTPENVAHNEALNAKMQLDFETQYRRRKAWEAQQLR